MGRTVDYLPPNSSEVKTFWVLHGFYSGLDLLKIAVGLAMAARIVIRRKPDKEAFAREYEMNLGTQQPKVNTGKSRG
jgi:hypothetical protein